MNIQTRIYKQIQNKNYICDEEIEQMRDQLSDRHAEVFIQHVASIIRETSEETERIIKGDRIFLDDYPRLKEFITFSSAIGSFSNLGGAFKNAAKSFVRLGEQLSNAYQTLEAIAFRNGLTHEQLQEIVARARNTPYSAEELLIREIRIRSAGEQYAAIRSFGRAGVTAEDLRMSLSEALKPKYLGNQACVNNARSQYLQCAVNPKGDCNNCQYLKFPN